MISLHNVNVYFLFSSTETRVSFNIYSRGIVYCLQTTDFENKSKQLQDEQGTLCDNIKLIMWLGELFFFLIKYFF